VEAIPHDVDALGAAAQEGEHLLNGVEAAEVALHFRHGGWEDEAFAEEHFEGASDGVDLIARHAGAFHADDVDADDVIDVLLNDERRNVLGGRGIAADHRQSAHADELLHGGVSRHDDVVLKDAMAADEGAVGENAAIADDAIVSDMAVHHEEIVVADNGFHGVGSAAMNGHLLAEDIAITDFDAGGFVIIFEMLWPFAQDGAGADEVAVTQAYGPEEVCAGADDAIVADAHGPIDDREGADFDVLAKAGLWRNDGSRVNSATQRKGHYDTPSPLGGVPRLTPATNP
jgi:hypothetical protein